MTTPSTNWMMRMLLIALAVALVFLVPAALGVDASGSSGLEASAGVSTGTSTSDVPPPDLETVKETAGAAHSEVEGTVGETPISTEPVLVTVEEATGVTESTSAQTAASEGGVEILSRPMTTSEAVAASAVVAAAGSAGALFWLKGGAGMALGRILGAPLFSRLSKDELLENGGRESLFQLVTENPGIGLQELANQSGLGWGTTVYHLGRLEQGGFISSMKNGQSRHFFKNGHPAASSKKAIAVLKNHTASDVARFLMSTPGATQTTISSRLGIAPPTVTKYIKRLEAEGLVETLKEGRSKIVQPTTALIEAMRHVDVPMRVETPVEQPAPHAVSAYA